MSSRTRGTQGDGWPTPTGSTTPGLQIMPLTTEEAREIVRDSGGPPTETLEAGDPTTTIAATFGHGRSALHTDTLLLDDVRPGVTDRDIVARFADLIMGRQGLPARLVKPSRTVTQRVSLAPGASIPLVSREPNRYRLILSVTAAAGTVWVGTDPNAAATGFGVAAGQSITIESTDGLWTTADASNATAVIVSTLRELQST